jgi:hypothetical protein
MAYRIGRLELLFWFVAASILMLKANSVQASRHWLVGLGSSPEVCPLVNLVALSLLMVVPGQKQPNLYGEPPIFFQRLRKLVAPSQSEPR